MTVPGSRATIVNLLIFSEQNGCCWHSFAQTVKNCKGKAMNKLLLKAFYIANIYLYQPLKQSTTTF